MSFKSAAQRGAYYEALKNKQGSNALGATPVQHNAAIVSSPLLPNSMPPKMAQPMAQNPAMAANVPPNPMKPINPAHANKFGKLKKII